MRIPLFVLLVASLCAEALPFASPGFASDTFKPGQVGKVGKVGKEKKKPKKQKPAKWGPVKVPKQKNAKRPKARHVSSLF